MKTFKEFLLERSGNISKGCSMMYFNFPEMEKIHSKIEKDDIYDDEEGGFGLEDDHHITLLYGFDKSVDGDVVNQKVMEMEIPNVIVLHNPSLFKKDEYDVLKFDVKNTDELSKINEMLTGNFPYENEYPVYHAHCTIGYLEVGAGDKYVDIFKDSEFEVIPEELVYSSPDNEKTVTKL